MTGRTGTVALRQTWASVAVVVTCPLLPSVCVFPLGSHFPEWVVGSARPVALPPVSLKQVTPEPASCGSLGGHAAGRPGHVHRLLLFPAQCQGVSIQ